MTRPRVSINSFKGKRIVCQFKQSHPLITILGLYIMIAVMWMGLEKIIYGAITYRVINDIVAVLFSVSLCYNLKKAPQHNAEKKK